MEESLFDVNKFNIIQDEENYYFFRALNMADNSDIEEGITTSKDGRIRRVRTDRERYEGTPKYTETSSISLEEVYDHIKMHYRKDTNCISLTSNSNVVINYGRGYYKDKYVIVKIPKKELGEKTVVAGQYLLKELYSRIVNAVENLPEEKRQEVLNIFSDIENSQDNRELQDIISYRYTAKKDELNPQKARLRKGINYSSPKSRISSYQALSEEQVLEVNKVYAKLAILENEQILKHVIPHSSNSKLRETIGNAFSSTELIHYGDIPEENIVEVPKEIVDIFSLIQQVSDIDENQLDRLKQAVITEVQNGKQIPTIAEIESEIKSNISIEEMYELTNGRVEYGKANSIVKNMFYLSKSRQNAIALSNVLRDILGNNSEFEEIIQYIAENGFRVEPEIISRKSGKGVKLSESVNLNLQEEEQPLIDEIKKLSSEKLDLVLQNGGLYNAENIVTKIFSTIQENEEIDRQKYYAEAIFSQYNWQNIGIEEFRTEERNELINRLQQRNCVQIYEQLKQIGIPENQIPTVLLNIVTREGFYEQYQQGNLEELLNTRQDVLQNDINIEVVERFLGYYDVENTGIKLKDYQKPVVRNIDRIFNDHKFAQVVLPTGAGKSFVALTQMQKYAAEHPNEKMLYLAPQEEILNQIKKYIVNNLHGKKGTVGKKNTDEIIAEVFPNITFETYPGLRAKRGQQVIKEQYGMIVLDELHRTGAKEWEGKIDSLLENQTDNVKVLGITATPTRDVDRRNMASETAKKLGYTDEEIKQRKHLASNMTLENAIRMGYVVNPKLIYCKYDLISSGKMDELRAQIDDIEDEGKRQEELEKYNDLLSRLNKEIDDEIGEEARKNLEEEARRNLEFGIGKEEILKQNVKKGGKYIVFIPVTEQGDIEDEDGNPIKSKQGEDKIKAYQDYLNSVFGGTDINPECYAMSGSWNGKGRNKSGEDRNQQELNAFESDNPDKTKFMVVMNKANEGLHISGVDGIIWFRALDKNSRILYLQQLGRAIYALDEDNPLPDDKRPVIIDLANNSLTVEMEKDFENLQPVDDLEALTIVSEWINEHDGMMPDRNSSNKQEQHYYAILRRIQNKYDKYLDGFDNFEDLTDEEKSDIDEIINLATEIDLWNIDLPPIPKTRGKENEFDPFTIEGVLRDFVELQDEVDTNERKTTYEEVIEFLETHNGQLMQSSFRKQGKTLKVDELTEEQKKEKRLYTRWIVSKEREMLEEYAGKPIESVPEEYREKIARLREFGLGKKEKTTYEEVIEFLENHEGQLMHGGFSEKSEALTRDKMTEEQKEELNLYRRWNRSKEKNILDQYAGEPIEKVPEKYREKIAKLREFGLGKTTYWEVVEFLENHGGQLMQSSFSQEGETLPRDKMTEEQREEVNLYSRWKHSKEKNILDQYAGEPIEKVPEEYREKVARLREFGLGKKKKTTYEEVIKFLKTHDGQLMQSSFSQEGEVLSRDKMTEEQREEVNLYSRWRDSKLKRILDKYAGEPIEKVPKEYREKVARLREFGLGKKEKTTYEEVVEFLETHDGKIMRSVFFKNGETLKSDELTEEQSNESKLYGRWKTSDEKAILDKYAGKSIESVPEEYREKIARLREFGLGKKEKTTYEEVVEFLETHDGRLMQGEFKRHGKRLNSTEMTEEQRKETNLYGRWKRFKVKKILDQYAGEPIESVPEEYREKIARLREFGLGLQKSKLQQAKQKRDEAKARNDEAKKLEAEVSEELKKRGHVHEEQ